MTTTKTRSAPASQYARHLPITIEAEVALTTLEAHEFSGHADQMDGFKDLKRPKRLRPGDQMEVTHKLPAGRWKDYEDDEETVEFHSTRQPAKAVAHASVKQDSTLICKVSAEAEGEQHKDELHHRYTPSAAGSSLEGTVRVTLHHAGPTKLVVFLIIEAALAVENSGPESMLESNNLWL